MRGWEEILSVTKLSFYSKDCEAMVVEGVDTCYDCTCPWGQVALWQVGLEGTCRCERVVGKLWCWSRKGTGSGGRIGGEREELRV